MSFSAFKCSNYAFLLSFLSWSCRNDASSGKCPAGYEQVLFPEKACLYPARTLVISCSLYWGSCCLL